MKRMHLPFRRRGSALIMVLGMLAVLTLMAVVFSTFVRTERSGTTNLKNGAVARNSLYSALGRVVEAIDLSFDGSAAGSGSGFNERYWPAAVWPHPWLASSNYPDDDSLVSEERLWLDPHLDSYFKEFWDPRNPVPANRPDHCEVDEYGKNRNPVKEGRERLTDKEWNDLAKAEDRKSARILTDEIAKHLSPSQLALARSAKCKWAPLRGSINATATIWPGDDQHENDEYGGVLEQVGRPEGDDLIGRYAFIVLDTTGLADMNVVGLNDDDDRDPSDPTTFVLPVNSAKKASGVRDDVGGINVKSFVKDLKEFNKHRFYGSIADARRACLPNTFDFGGDDGFEKDETLPADLFAGFSPSLQELNPAGRPKIYLPTQEEFDRYEAPAVKNFFGRVFGAMVAVFARSRAADAYGSQSTAPTAYGKDHIEIFQGVNDVTYKLNRSAFAAVSIMDGLDGDNKPGEFSPQRLKYWTLFENEDVYAPHKVCGATPKEKVLANVARPAIRNDPLNFPCTESAFLLESVCAWIEWDAPDERDPIALEDELEYVGHIRVMARAHCMNKTEESSEHESRMELSWETMSGNPQDGCSSLDGDEPDILHNWLQFGSDTDKIDWSEWEMGLSGTAEGESGTFDDETPDGNRFFSAPETPFGANDTTFTVRVHACTNGLGELKWYPLTKVEYDLNPDYEGFGRDGELPSGTSEHPDVWVPIRIQVTIQDKKGNGSYQDVQMVPAPALEDTNPGGWWIRVNPCVYHGPASTYGNKDDCYGHLEEGGGNAAGWAYCLAPPFAFDTTSLRDPNGGNDMNFWISDLAGRPAEGGGGWGSDMGHVDALIEQLWAANNANVNVKDWIVEPHVSWDGSAGGSLQTEWLGVFDNSDPDNHLPVVEWLCKENNGNRFMPDFLHSAGRTRHVFHVESGETFSLSEFYTRIPAKGWKHPADLGGAMCGPYETLSLFKTWRKSDVGGVDFHPVLDYFAPESDRYPSTNDIRKFVMNDIGSGKFGFDPEKGDMKWDDLSDDDLYSALHNGRVNLNAPPLVKATQVSQEGDALRGDLFFNEKAAPEIGEYLPLERNYRRNPFPIATVFNGAEVFSKRIQGTMKPRTIGETEAFVLAFDVCRMLEQADRAKTNDVAFSYPVSHRFSFPRRTKFRGDDTPYYLTNFVRRPLVKGISFLCGGTDDDNQLLHDFVIYPLDGENSNFRRPENDADRESLLRATVDGFTTRGQTFIAIIRADAYSPKYGENESAEDGATLATTHALVELFRDPVPVRAPDGSLPTDRSGRPILYHNWYIRSFRVF